MGSGSLITLLLAAVAFSAGGIAVSKFLTKGSTNPQKGQAYECGVPAAGSAWKQFHVGYDLFALIFLIFEVEMVFMFPWAVVAKQVGMLALFEILIFVFILFMGFLYAHKKGALKWM
jgi:NADH-quinone oxidoreductase subunit A